MFVDQFTDAFRVEHRTIRDTLFALMEAFQARDKARIQPLLRQTAAITGPHFRYEEEALYPNLVGIFGEEYIEKLIGDHDRAIGSARSLVTLAGQDTLTAEDVARATRIIQSILPHVSDCEGLSIMVETFPEETVQTILTTRQNAREAGLDLLTWADQVRARN